MMKMKFTVIFLILAQIAFIRGSNFSETIQRTTMDENEAAQKGDALDQTEDDQKTLVSDKTAFRDEGVIPDEETALAVGKIILEKYAGKKMEYETDEKRYYLIATYFKETNTWCIMQWFDYKNGGGWAASGIYLPYVKINKSTGEVLYINTYSTFDDR